MMMCEECGQNPATVILALNVNGESTQKHLCASCMEKLKTSFSKGDLQSFLTSILSDIAATDMPEKELNCSRCGLSYREFKKTGRLGCAQCYQDFRDELKPMLLKIHGRSQHAGRMPRISQKEQEQQQMLCDLRKRMEEAVSQENFEEAALLRDQIKQLASQE
ncbi:MAG: UvrB/UvrC motif-containing protein [Clostridia bacterium]|nr:UvrB/UvrC motif-containing protein [Clostridia bacterium]